MVCCGDCTGCILAPFFAEPMNCGWCILVFRSRYDLTKLEPFTSIAVIHCSPLYPSPQQEGFGYVKAVLISLNRILLFYLEAKNCLHIAVLKKTGSDRFSHFGLV